ncbi:hypothetical protein GJ631_01765 [Natronomonas sp. CBA1123]|nr:hypothetical protein [Natronomonas sp. CBA1123]
MASPEATLSDFIATVTYEEVPERARETVRRAFLDTVGVTLAGALDDAGTTVFDMDDIDSSTASASTILGIGSARSPSDRALHTGTASHALDYDDLAWAMDGHPSVTLVPPTTRTRRGIRRQRRRPRDSVRCRVRDRMRTCRAD